MCWCSRVRHPLCPFPTATGLPLQIACSSGEEVRCRLRCLTTAAKASTFVVPKLGKLIRFDALFLSHMPLLCASGLWNQTQPAWLDVISQNVNMTADGFKLLFGKMALQNPRNLQGTWTRQHSFNRESKQYVCRSDRRCAHSW